MPGPSPCRLSLIRACAGAPHFHQLGRGQAVPADVRPVHLRDVLRGRGAHPVRPERVPDGRPVAVVGQLHTDLSGTAGEEDAILAGLQMMRTRS